EEAPEALGVADLEGVAAGGVRHLPTVGPLALRGLAGRDAAKGGHDCLSGDGDDNRPARRTSRGPVVNASSDVQPRIIAGRGSLTTVVVMRIGIRALPTELIPTSLGIRDSNPGPRH